MKTKVPTQCLLEARLFLILSLLVIPITQPAPLANQPSELKNLGFGFSPVWAPDSKRLAFIGTIGTLHKVTLLPFEGICIINADGTGRKGLSQIGATGPVRGLAVRWAANGDKIAAVLNSKITKVPKGETFRYGFTIWNIFTINPDGTDEKQATHRDYLYYDSFDFSPDAKIVAFVAEKTGVLGYRTIVRRTKKLDEAPGPDNPWIIQDVERPYKAIWIAQADGSRETQLTNSPNCDDYDPKFSPDGSKIAFTRVEKKDKANFWSICIMNKDGSGLQQLTKDGWSSGPFWSPKGDKIAYFRFDGLENNIWIMNNDGSGNRQVTRTGADSTCDLAWTPDGNRIIYVLNGNIWSISLDGAVRKQITRCGGIDQRFSLSPDGRKVAFEKRGDRGIEIWVAEVP